MKLPIRFLLAAGLALAAFPAPARAADAPANALLLVPSETAFDPGFQDFLEKSGAKLLESHPPSVFVGHIPQELDKTLEEKYGARVYRGKVDDWASFARYGENAVFAVNAWNKRFVEDPPAAPLVVSARVQKAGRRARGLKLDWNEVMKAGSYLLQISRAPEFSEIYLETLLSGSHYLLYPQLLPDGIYYWRVAPVLKLNTGRTAEKEFSGVYDFAVSNPRPAAGGARPPAPAQRKVFLERGLLRWRQAPGDRYFRVQIADTADFAAPTADVFTDTCAFRVSSLPVNVIPGQYLRFMGSDGERSGGWSAPLEIAPAAENPADRRRARGRR